MAIMLLGVVAVSFVVKDLVEDEPLNHGVLAVGVSLMAFSGSLLLFIRLSRETPLWKVSGSTRERTRRDVALTSAGVFLSLAGFATGILSFHQAQLEEARAVVDKHLFVAICLEAIGIVGLLMFVMGAKFSGEPRLFLIDEEVKAWKSKSYRNLGVTLMVMGAALALAMIGIVGLFYQLADPVFGGAIVAAAITWIFLHTVGVLLYRGRPPLMGPLHPSHESPKRR